MLLMANLWSTSCIPGPYNQGFIQKFWLRGGGGGEIKCMLGGGGGGGGGGGFSVIFPVKRRSEDCYDLSAVNFDEVLDIFKQKNRQIRL